MQCLNKDMKIKLLFFVMLAIFVKGQNKIFDFSENDFDDSKKIYEAVSYINSEMKIYDFKIDNQYNIKTLLDKIKFYERMSEEILKEQNSDLKKGLMKSIIIFEEQTIKRAGIQIFDENERPEDFVQIMKGGLRAMRRMTLRNVLEEYNHFLKIKLAD